MDAKVSVMNLSAQSSFTNYVDQPVSGCEITPVTDLIFPFGIPLLELV